jgi:hypothetical protein
MTSSVRIDVLWNLRDLRQPSESWTLYVNQIPIFESQALQDAFYDPARPDLILKNHSDLMAQIEGLVAEVSTLLPEVQAIEGFQPDAFLSSIVHWPTGLWQGPALEKLKIRWVRNLLLGNRRFGSGTDEGEIMISQLSNISATAIHRLDELAIETAYRRHQEDLSRLKDIPLNDLPPLRKVHVFISYRRSQFEAAKQLHSIITNYANGSIFSAYLDHHSMRTGQWLPQILAAIEACDIFMPIVSEDFAAMGTIGRIEFEKAIELSKNRSLSDFFAPIFISHPKSDVALFLYDYDGFDIDEHEEISVNNHNLDHFLARVATSVLQR